MGGDIAGQLSIPSHFHLGIDQKYLVDSNTTGDVQYFYTSISNFSNFGHQPIPSYFNTSIFLPRSHLSILPSSILQLPTWTLPHQSRRTPHVNFETFASPGRELRNFCQSGIEKSNLFESRLFPPAICLSSVC